MTRKNLILYQAVAFAYLLAAACGQPVVRKAKEASTSQSAENGATQFRVETIASGLEVPWAITFTPDGRILFTERAGRVRVIENGKLRHEALATIEEVEQSGESGLMDLTLHPQFTQNDLLYLAYAYPGDGQRLVERGHTQVKLMALSCAFGIRINAEAEAMAFAKKEV